MFLVYPILFAFSFFTSSILTFDIHQLASQAPTWKQILTNNKKKTFSAKNHPGIVLGYITPWNKHGYENSLWNSQKFDYLSPTWFEIKRNRKGDYSVSGDENINFEWLSSIRSKTPNIPKIIPRFEARSWKIEDYEEINNPKSDADFKEDVQGFIQTIVKKCLQYGFDGVVFEATSPQHLIPFMKFLGYNLHELNLSFILVVPVYNPKIDKSVVRFNKKMYESLKTYVDAFSLNLYSWAYDLPGPNAPISWVESEIKKLCTDDCGTLLLGMNFYGTDYGLESASVNSIISNANSKIMAIHEPLLIWDPADEEHYYYYAGKYW